MPPRPGGLYLDRVALWRLLAGYGTARHGTARQNQGNRLALDFQVTFSTERQLLAGDRDLHSRTRRSTWPNHLRPSYADPMPPLSHEESCRSTSDFTGLRGL